MVIRFSPIFLLRTYVQQNSLDNIYNMGLVLFREVVVLDGSIQYHMGVTLLDMVLKERRGEEVIDRELLKNACKMLVALGIEGEHHGLVYQDLFEESFLDRSARFFSSESQKLLKQNSASFYIRKVEARMDLEAMRTSQYLDNATIPKVVRVMEEELIKHHMETIVDMKGSGVEFMLRNDRTDDLACMYKLFGRVGEEGNRIIGDCISRFIRQSGKSTVIETTDANAFIKNLLELKDKFDNILEISFRNDMILKRVISDCFEYLLNLNSRSPEFLSLFIDSELQKEAKGLDEEEVDEVLDKSLTLFRFLQEKDMFEEYFRRHQMDRLLNQNSLEGSERMMISKLKAECGGQFTTNLEDMFRDIDLSATLNKEFHNQLCNTSDTLMGVCISVKVLKQSSWPGKESHSPVNLPPVPAQAFAAFENFYLSKWKVESQRRKREKECSKKLILQPDGGNAELNFNTGEKTEHVICVNTYQMIILLIFNSRERVAFKEIAAETLIPDKELKRALLPLFSNTSQQILIKSPESCEIKGEDIFSVNNSFTSAHRRVKIQQGISKGGEGSTDHMETVEKIEVDRKGELEAYIVRIMKSRKQVQHSRLVAELIALVSKRFHPSPLAIKTRIEALIDKEYMKRSDHDNTCYIYLA